MRKAFCLSLNYLKIYIADYREESYCRDDFLYQKDLSAQHSKHVFTVFLFLFHVSLVFLSIKVIEPYFFLLSSGWQISLNCLPALEYLLSLWGSHTYIIKFVLLLVYIISIWLLGQQKKLEGKKEKNLSVPTMFGGTALIFFYKIEDKFYKEEICLLDCVYPVKMKCHIHKEKMVQWWNIKNTKAGRSRI